MTTLFSLYDYVQENPMDSLGYYALADYMEEMDQDYEDYIIKYRKIAEAILLKSWTPKVTKKITNIKKAVGYKGRNITIVVADHLFTSSQSAYYEFMERISGHKPYVANLTTEGKERINIDFAHRQVIECENKGKFMKIYCHPLWVNSAFPFPGGES